MNNSLTMASIISFRNIFRHNPLTKTRYMIESRDPRIATRITIMPGVDLPGLRGHCWSLTDKGHRYIVTYLLPIIISTITLVYQLACFVIEW